ncbi:hypothetical protein A2U01_0095875 [Trifolium medium]|uniref:Uncharacterized protein n=1 Tax=Trifolium medium TaxID=97028 RepID=A0A392ULZ7_9FABA|nr:hypothetical protein [Trifolium medium]
MVRLGRYLLWELNPTLPEFRGMALGQDVLARSSKGSVAREQARWPSRLPVLVVLSPVTTFAM